MGSDQPYHIALWGAPRVGKTALLAFLLDSNVKTDWDVQPLKESRLFVKSMREYLHRNHFPAATAMEHTDVVVYRLMRGTQRAILRVEDVAGGKWIKHDDPELARLRDAQALILLIDPNHAPLLIEQQIRHMLDRLTEDGDAHVVTCPVAVCVTKVDASIERPEELDEVTHHGDAFVRRKMSHAIREELRTVMRRRCPRHRFFPISSVGVRAESGVVRHAVLMDEQLRFRPTASGTPLNLTAPFDWIFEQLGALGATR